MVLMCFFFFQAEDGIRDHCVTGVQTCALPISQKMAVADGALHVHLQTVLVKDRNYTVSYVQVPTLDKQDADGRKQFLRSEEHTSELQSHSDLVCRLLLEKKKKKKNEQKEPTGQ